MSLVEIVRSMHTQFSQGRLVELAESAHPEVTVDAAALGQVFHGREGFLAFMSTFQTAFPDIALTHTWSLESGHTAVVESRWTGTHTGPLVTPAGTVPPTGRRVQGGRILEVFEFDGGRLIGLKNYQDIGSWMRELGLA